MKSLLGFIIVILSIIYFGIWAFTTKMQNDLATDHAVSFVGPIIIFLGIISIGVLLILLPPSKKEKNKQ